MFRRLGALIVVFAAVACSGTGARDEPLTPSDHEVERHTLTLIEPVYRTEIDMFGIAVELSVSESGVVTAARTVPDDNAPDPPRDLRTEAIANARAARFEPFLKDGVAHPARFTVLVPIQSPPRPVVRRVPFPDPSGQDVLIRLARSCYGPCPIYSVEVRGDGQVTYLGGGFVAVGGRHQRQISPEAVQALLDLFRQTDFFSLEDSYGGGMHIPENEVTLTIGGQTKTVMDYAGGKDGMPFGVTRLQHAMDRTAGVWSWHDGDATTAAWLEAEGYDFTNHGAGEALVWMAWNGSEDAATDFVTRGAPLLSRGDLLDRERRGSAAEGAASTGKARLLQALLQAGAITDPEVAETVLTAAASSLDPATLETALGIRQFTRRQLGQALGAALSTSTYRSRRPDPSPVADRLLALHAEVTVADREGRTPLHGAHTPEMVRRLLARGADLEARDRLGATPIMTAEDEEVVLALMTAGADLTVDPRYGPPLRKKAATQGWNRVLVRLDR